MLDEVLFYVAPKLIGGTDGLSVVGGSGLGKLKDALEFRDFEVDRVDGDLKARGNLNFY